MGQILKSWINFLQNVPPKYEYACISICGLETLNFGFFGEIFYGFDLSWMPWILNLHWFSYTWGFLIKIEVSAD